MRLVEAYSGPRDESWRKAFTPKIIKETVEELGRVISALDKAPDVTGMIDDFYSEYDDRLDLQSIKNLNKLSYNVSSTKFYIEQLEWLVDRDEIFFLNYQVPKRSTNDSNPIWKASKSYPNGRYIKKVTNLEEYFILTCYAYDLISSLEVGRGLSDEFMKSVERIYNYLETAYNLIEKFVNESEKYKEILHDKNR